MTQPNSKKLPQFVDVGLTGVLIPFSDTLSESANRAALAFRARLEAAALPGVQETTTSLTSAFVIYDPQTLPRIDLHRHLTDLLATQAKETAALPENRKLWRIPAVFGGDGHGPQLKEAAALAGVSPDQAITEICANPLRVMTIGFAPGQPYLGSLPDHWDIPRQIGLTKQVPIGAITLAIRQIVLFATSSPTGWRQVGQCAFHGFRPKAADPFALTPGDEILFHPVMAEELAQIKARDPSGAGGATWKRL